MKIEFTLQKTLDDLDINRRQFSRMTGIRSNTIIDICAGTTQRISIDVIERILTALQDHSGQPHGIDSIMRHKAD